MFIKEPGLSKASLWSKRPQRDQEKECAFKRQQLCVGMCVFVSMEFKNVPYNSLVQLTRLINCDLCYMSCE